MYKLVYVDIFFLYNCATHNFGLQVIQTDQGQRFVIRTQFVIVTKKIGIIALLMHYYCDNLPVRRATNTNEITDMWTWNQPKFNWNGGSNIFLSGWYLSYFNWFNDTTTSNISRNNGFFLLFELFFTLNTWLKAEMFAFKWIPAKLV